MEAKIDKKAEKDRRVNDYSSVLPYLCTHESTEVT